MYNSLINISYYTPFQGLNQTYLLLVSNSILARQYTYFTSKCYICLLDFIPSTQSFFCSILLYPKDFEEFMSAYVFSYALSGLLAIKSILAKVHMSTNFQQWFRIRLYNRIKYQTVSYTHLTLPTNREV